MTRPVTLPLSMRPLHAKLAPPVRFGKDLPRAGWSSLIEPQRELSPAFLTGAETVLGKLPGPILDKLISHGVKLILVPDIYAGLRGLTRMLVKRADKQARRQEETFRAIYLPLTNKIVIPEFTLTGKPSDVPMRIPNGQIKQFEFLVLHEVGHAVDYCLGRPKFNLPIIKHCFPTFSRRPAFIEAYEKDLSRRSEPLPYGVSTPTEAFATLFAATFMSSEKELLAEFPNVVSYLKTDVVPVLVSQ